MPVYYMETSPFTQKKMFLQPTTVGKLYLQFLRVTMATVGTLTRDEFTSGQCLILSDAVCQTKACNWMQRPRNSVKRPSVLQCSSSHCWLHCWNYWETELWGSGASAIQSWTCPSECPLWCPLNEAFRGLRLTTETQLKETVFTRLNCQPGTFILRALGILCKDGSSDLKSKGALVKNYVLVRSLQLLW